MTEFQEGEVREMWEEVLGKEAYRLKIREIGDTYPEERSLLVDYSDIDSVDTEFAMFVLENPDFTLKIGKDLLNMLMPADWNPRNEVNLRIINLPRDVTVDIRKLRANHLGKLIAVEGLVKNVSSVKPRMVGACFACARCGTEMYEKQNGMFLREPMMCTNPSGGCNKPGMRFNLIESKCVFIDMQRVEIQESPEGLRGGAQPERLTGYLVDDISGTVTPGNRITLNGIIRSAEKSDRDKSTVFEIYLDILSVEFEQHEYDEIQITEEDEQKILEMSRDPYLFDNIVKSISPTIYGMTEVKSAIALQLFGGCHKEMDDGSVIRGDMHILLVGDPGVAKSQVLRYMSSLAPRGIYASGKSASAAGLTAAAVKDDFEGGWTLEAGALVLADKGLACIDELDKMTDQDRSSLHEAMESQRISVAKAGITAALQCRCSMLAAANPKFGRFETEGASLASQIDLPPALMSRFDLIFVMTDRPDKNYDTRVTEHILNVHRRGEVNQLSEDKELKGVDVKNIKEMTLNIKPYYELDMLRKYVAYSKRFVPVMTDVAYDLIRNAYVKIRLSGQATDSVPITARQLEAFVRLSEASARMRLSETVDASDAERAISLVTYYLDKVTGGNGDMDIITADYSKKDRNSMNFLLGLIRSSPEGLTIEDLVAKAQDEGYTAEEVHDRMRKILNAGSVYVTTGKRYKVA
ncbi:MAG: minichromosome maintenance protein MCM [archaeon]|nr:minichromosome maintenance protein MCM [archaeon]